MNKDLYKEECKVTNLAEELALKDDECRAYSEKVATNEKEITTLKADLATDRATIEAKTQEIEEIQSTLDDKLSLL